MQQSLYLIFPQQPEKIIKTSINVEKHRNIDIAIILVIIEMVAGLLLLGAGLLGWTQGSLLQAAIAGYASALVIFTACVSSLTIFYKKEKKNSVIIQDTMIIPDIYVPVAHKVYNVGIMVSATKDEEIKQSYEDVKNMLSDDIFYSSDVPHVETIETLCDMVEEHANIILEQNDLDNKIIHSNNYAKLNIMNNE